jgi:uncharacterized membrane protein (UPF0127 family)
VTQATISVVRFDGTPVSTECGVASTLIARIRGLLGRRQLGDDEGLLIRRTASIHTHFMRFRIDVVFLAADGTALRIVENLAPWRMRCSRRARHVLELPAGRCGQIGLQAGERLKIAEAG